MKGLVTSIRNPGVKQCLGFCAADFWTSLAYKSAEQKPKHCLTPGFLIPLLRTIPLTRLQCYPSPHAQSQPQVQVSCETVAFKFRLLLFAFNNCVLPHLPLRLTSENGQPKFGCPPLKFLLHIISLCGLRAAAVNAEVGIGA